MRILICDDDNAILSQLQTLLESYFHSNHLTIPEIVVYNRSEDLLADSGMKDIVFLDVEMPGISGITAGRRLKKQNRNAIIIMVTSFSEYLDEAMRFHVFRYLSKPIERQRLYLNMDDALRQYSSISYRIAIETKEGVVTVRLQDIIYIETYDRKTIIHTTKQDHYSIKNLSEWVSALPSSRFFRTHHSFLINMSHVAEFDHKCVYLYNHRFSAYLTRRCYKPFKDAYLLYLESMR